MRHLPPHHISCLPRPGLPFHDDRPEELRGKILESNPNGIQVECYTRHSPLHEDLNTVFVHNSEAYHRFLAEDTTSITLNSSHKLQLVMKNDRARHWMSDLWERPWHYPEEELEVGIPVHKVWHFKFRFELVEDRLSAMGQVMQLFHDQFDRFGIRLQPHTRFSSKNASLGRFNLDSLMVHVRQCANSTVWQVGYKQGILCMSMRG
jgi:hypothetical protein